MNNTNYIIYFYIHSSLYNICMIHLFYKGKNKIKNIISMIIYYGFMINDLVQ